MFSIVFGDSSNSAEVLRLLLRHGADVSATDRKASTVSSCKAELIAAHLYVNFWCTVDAHPRICYTRSGSLELAVQYS